MRMMLRAFRAVTFALGCLAAAEASAQDMTISAYTDQWVDVDYVWHGVDYFDDTWACSHGNYTTLATLTGPTGFASWEPGGLSSYVGLPYAVGDFLGEAGLSFDCSCVYPDRVEYTAYAATPFQTLPLPTGESSSFEDWMQSGGNRAKARFKGHLQGGNFSGRMVLETDYAAAEDTCWHANSIYPKASGVSGGSWMVDGNSSYGLDSIGWGETLVQYYRGLSSQQGSINQTPCHFQMHQKMAINTMSNNNTQFSSYKQNVLRAYIRFATVESTRDGVSSGELTWP